MTLLKTIGALIIFIVVAGSIALPKAAMACPSGTYAVGTKVVTCLQDAAEPSTDKNACTGYNNCDLIQLYLNPLIDLLSAAFGLIAVISLIMGGIEYSSSEGDPQKSSKAKNRIAKTIVAIVAYFFLYAFLQFIVPGGVFNPNS